MVKHGIFLAVIGLFVTVGAGAQLPNPYQASPEALKQFKDPNVGRHAIKAGDKDNDGFLSKEEADALESLNLTSYRIDPFEVRSYEDLAQFPNLKALWLGDSDLEEVDLSKNLHLEMVGIQSDALKVLVLAVGCTPKITYPVHSGEIVVRRVVNPDDPNSIWYR